MESSLLLSLLVLTFGIISILIVYFKQDDITFVVSNLFLISTIIGIGLYRIFTEGPSFLLILSPLLWTTVLWLTYKRYRQLNGDT